MGLVSGLQWKRVHLDANIFVYAVERMVKDLNRPITSANDNVGTTPCGCPGQAPVPTVDVAER